MIGVKSETGGREVWRTHIFVDGKNGIETQEVELVKKELHDECNSTLPVITRDVLKDSAGLNVTEDSNGLGATDDSNGFTQTICVSSLASIGDDIANTLIRNATFSTNVTLSASDVSLNSTSSGLAGSNVALTTSNGALGVNFDNLTYNIQNGFDRIYDLPASNFRSELSSTPNSLDTTSSPSPPPPPRSYKPCFVCNDKSSGYHYGVSSCEGCKGFFRRSVQKNMQYTCHKDKSCEINKMTRNRCQYCRLVKCYASGMSKEAVRNDRNKRRKVKQDGCVTSAGFSDELTADEEGFISKILQAHQETSHQDSEHRLDLSDLEKGVYLWNRIAELSADGIMQIVQFCKKVPGFATISKCDQVILLKAACLEIIVLRLCCRYQDEEDAILFSRGLLVTRPQVESGVFGGGGLTDEFFQFCASLHQMDVDQNEYAMLCATCLLSSDRSGLQDCERIEKLQEPMLEALKHYVRKRRVSNPAAFAGLLLKLSDLRQISVKGGQQVLDLRFCKDGEAPLPPLIVEMLDRVENVVSCVL